MLSELFSPHVLYHSIIEVLRVTNQVIMHIQNHPFIPNRFHPLRLPL